MFSSEQDNFIEKRIGFLLYWYSGDKSSSIAVLLKLADEIAFPIERHNIGKWNLLINVVLVVGLFFLSRSFWKISILCLLLFVNTLINRTFLVFYQWQKSNCLIVFWFISFLTFFASAAQQMSLQRDICYDTVSVKLIPINFKVHIFIWWLSWESLKLRLTLPLFVA